MFILIMASFYCGLAICMVCYLRHIEQRKQRLAQLQQSKPKSSPKKRKSSNRKR